MVIGIGIEHAEAAVNVCSPQPVLNKSCERTKRMYVSG